MGTVIQDMPPRTHRSQPRWDRFERADLFAQYQELRTQGISERQAAKALNVPRTTLQAWRRWHDTLDMCPHVAAFFQSGLGLAFVHRVVLAFHLVCVAIGACGIRLVCLLLHLTGLDRFVAASSGAQQQVNRRVEAAIVVYRQDETARLAQDMPRKAITVTQDETCTGGLCLVPMDPESNFLIVEQLAQAHDHVMWHALMAPALAQCNCEVIQSTSDAAPGLLAYGEHSLQAHHSPDLFHVQHELVKAVSGPLATKERAAHKAVTAAREQLEQVQTHPQSAGDEHAKRGPGRPPEEPVPLEQATQALEAARREHERLVQQRAQVQEHIRAIGHDSHVVDLKRGVRRNGQLIAADIHEHIKQVRAVAQHEGLSQSGLERLEKAERVVPKMQATIAFVSGYVRQQVAQLHVPQPASCAMHAKLIPSYYLDRVAQTRTVSAGEPLRTLAARLRAPLFAPAGVFSALGPEAQEQLRNEARGWRPCSSARAPMWRDATATYPCAAIHCADSICRASGSALPPCTTFSSPALMGRRRRSDFSGRNLVAWLLPSWHLSELLPAPLRPPRRGLGSQDIG